MLGARFVESLSARVHSLPPSIDRISSLFQEFYTRTDAHIATHISTLASRINRDTSPSKSTSATTTQMLTVSEISERRKARKQLPLKQLALEETVERRVCEKVYSKIWRHKSSLDEVRDEKLRSKTAALSVLGMGLRDLGIEISDSTGEKEQHARARLAAAGDELKKMNDAHYPLGKLQYLILAHKAIVDSLTVLLGSSSSADEILPALIFTLISSPLEGINVISNLLFIQRFRAVGKINGESAYCLTNLEAAISFLESVDLSSVSTDAPVDGQPRLLNATTTPPADISSSSRTSRTGKDGTTPATLSRNQLSAPSTQQRRLSNLFQPPAKVLGAANDAMRSTADQGLKNISNTLDNSFNFLFGRLKEMQNTRGANEPALVPKTLDEARRLVTNPPVLSEGDLGNEESFPASENSDALMQRPNLKPDDRRHTTKDGRRTPRDRSADSSRSSEMSSSYKPSTLPVGRLHSTSTPSPNGSSSVFSPSPATTPLESMKNFGNTFNPLNHIPGMIRGFGRNLPETPPSGPSSVPSGGNGGNMFPERPGLTSASRTSATNTSSSTIPFPTVPFSEADPPIRRFLELEDPHDLRIGDVAELLQDYKRLAGLLAEREKE